MFYLISRPCFWWLEGCGAHYRQSRPHPTWSKQASKQAQHKNILSSGPSVTLPVRNSRSCNALAFSIADPNHLAVGLDKVRGDFSLIIWDISTLTSSPSLPITAPTNVTTSASRPQPYISRLDNQARVDSRILQQHAPTEVVSFGLFTLLYSSSLGCRSLRPSLSINYCHKCCFKSTWNGDRSFRSIPCGVLRGQFGQRLGRPKTSPALLIGMRLQTGQELDQGQCIQTLRFLPHEVV